jgi:hypothetical protein
MSKREWGNATWAVLHTLARKLQTSEPAKVAEAVAVLAGVATRLPCPDCSQHAGAALREVARRHPIRTQHQLETTFWVLHNMANERLGKPFYPWEKIGRYSQLSTARVLQAYYTAMNRVSAAGRGVAGLLAESWRRDAVVRGLQRYLKDRAYLYSR